MNQPPSDAPATHACQARTPTAPDFTSQCDQCAALCCLALAFDQGPSFAHTKPAGMPCHNLKNAAPSSGCSIHADLTLKGYSGCVAYDCLGAGQRVTAMFDSDWKITPRLAGPMMDAFRIMRDIQELRQLLYAAQALPLPQHIEAERTEWLKRLQNNSEEVITTADSAQQNMTWTAASLSGFASARTAGEIRAWLRGLAGHISG